MVSHSLHFNKTNPPSSPSPSPSRAHTHPFLFIWLLRGMTSLLPRAATAKTTGNIWAAMHVSLTCVSFIRSFFCTSLQTKVVKRQKGGKKALGRFSHNAASQPQPAMANYGDRGHSHLKILPCPKSPFHIIILPNSGERCSTSLLLSKQLGVFKP